MPLSDTQFKIQQIRVLLIPHDLNNFTRSELDLPLTDVDHSPGQFILEGFAGEVALE